MLKRMPTASGTGVAGVKKCGQIAAKFCSKASTAARLMAFPETGAAGDAGIGVRIALGGVGVIRDARRAAAIAGDRRRVVGLMVSLLDVLVKFNKQTLIF